MSLHVVILAAGQGTRMRSEKPKVLHELAGKPLLGHVIDTANALGPEQIHVVYGHGGDQVKETFKAQSITWALQEEQLGTAHAVEQAMPEVPGDAVVLVLYGDVPLVREATLRRLLTAVEGHDLALLTTTLVDPTGYGRVVRDDNNQVERIVEQKDATAEQRKIQEINTGLMAIRAKKLSKWLERIGNENAQGEYYLTDLVALAVEDECAVATVESEATETAGINDRAQLAEAEQLFRLRCARRLLKEGVAIRDPNRLDVRGFLTAGQDVSIDINCIFIGDVTLGDRVTIGANCVIIDSHIEDGTEIKPFSHLENVRIGKSGTIGPYARLRPGAVLADEVHIGNFVEVKKSHIGDGSKVNHLSYIGDAEVGKGVNVGAGTITCNYDGANKHLTQIDDAAFIGSNSSLVAPVVVGAGATLGAGTVLSKDAPPGSLTVSRAPQRSIENWERPTKADADKTDPEAASE